jgi:hypothetical protein
MTDLYRQRRFSEALSVLQDLAARLPEDRPVRIYLERVERYSRESVPQGWDAVEVLDSK